MPALLRPRGRRLLAAAVGSATLLGTLGVALSAQATAQATAVTGPGAREAAFASASTTYGVPQSVLEAISYSLSRWEGHAGQHNTDGGFGPMSLVDGTVLAAAGQVESQQEGKGQGGVGATAAIPASVDTLGAAAALLGVSRQTLRDDPQANIRGGAALLAQEQRTLGLPVGAGTDPGQWYAAVAHASGASEQEDATDFADDAFASLSAGASRTTTDGMAVAMPARAVSPQRAQVTRLGLATAAANPNVDCPRGLGCEWLPAPYQQYYDDQGNLTYGNHDIAQRDVGSPKIDFIVIHDTEGSYQTTLQLVQDPTYVSWNYTVRSSDGHIAQHVNNKDVAYHAGNWYINTHSIGIEHEGYAAQGATWFTEAMYRKSAKLVSYLTTKYGIPVDRAHIIGHDQVPGIAPAYIAGMHWDPGPYWDWEHYFALLGHPLSSVTATPSSEIVRILPGFAGNKQPVTGCDDPPDGTPTGHPCAVQATNFVYLRTAPSDTAPLVRDVGLHGSNPSTYDVADIAARATAGMEFAVAGRQGSWTEIWYLGKPAWFKNPTARPTAIAVPGSYVVPKADKTSVPVFGVAYPKASEYPADFATRDDVPLPYRITSGQRVVLADATVATDDYYAKTFDGKPPTDHVDVVGQERFYEVSLGHRVAFVRATDVDIVKAR